MSFITSIGVAVPPHKIEQSVITGFMQNLSKSDEEKRKIATVFRASGIKTRHSALADYGKNSDFDFFPNSVDMNPFPGTASRMEAYRKHAIGLSMAAIEDCKKKYPFDSNSITHLITVSCTGMYAPGLDIDLINQLSLSASVNRTCLNFMGCFAAISAIKMADAFCTADPSAKILVVCTELCSLHFQKNFNDDNILANALFADGAAALIVECNPTAKHSLFIEGFYSNILPNGAPHMAWTIGDQGFEMRLSAYVPDVVSEAIDDLFNHLLQTVHINPDEVVHYAVHPGGRKILDGVANKLKIENSKLQHSYDVLRDYGNMSSPTVLFVLNQLMQSGDARKGDQIVVLAFGPGITIESMMLKAM